jgi:PAS domain S-box-containing protein
MGKISKNKIIEDRIIFQAVFDNCMDAILLTSPDGNIYLANQAACSMFQMTEEEICDLGRKGLVDIDSPHLTKMLEEREQTGRTSGELIMRKKDGTKFPVDISTSVFTDNTGQLKTSMIIRDITERKQAEERLRASEAQLRAIHESLTEGIVYLDTNGTVVSINSAVSKVVGRSLQDLTHPELDPRWRIVRSDGSLFPVEEQPAILALRTGEPVRDVEMGVPLPDGSLKWILVNAELVRDSLRTNLGVVVSFRDITRHKQAEEALRESETRHRLLFEQSLDGMAYLQVLFKNGKVDDYVYLQVNEAYYVQTGLKNVVGRRVSEIVPGIRESNPELFERYGRVVLTGQPEKYETYVAPLKTWFFTSLYRLTEDTVVSVFDNITERKHAEEEVRRLNERITLATRSAKIGIWDWDIDTNELIWDDKMYEIYGREKDTFKGAYETWLHSLHPDDKERYIKVCGDVFRDINGNPVRMLGVNFDITEQKKAEISLRESEESLKQTSQELRRLSRHLDELIEKERSEIARDLHDDLGQKLTAVNLHISWIKSRIGVQPGSVSDKIDSIKNLLNETVKSMHEISYRLKPSILEDLGLQAAVELQLADFSKSTGIGYSVSYIPEKLVVNYEISLMLFRIIQESLTNVARHSNATEVSVDVSSDEADLELTIRDNGIGLERDYQKKLKSFGILGMRERALAYGGEFQIEGIKDKGTTVTVKIPLIN